jgi:hypothetical protein
MKIIPNLNVLRYLFLVVAMVGFIATNALGVANAGQAVSTQLGIVCGYIQTFVGVLAVVLLALGAVLYAVSFVLPAAGNIKGNLQGWALNMVVGAVVALVVYFLAPFIAEQIVHFGSGGGGITASSITC